MNKYNLLDILDGRSISTDGKASQKISGIQIPIIQRDYAQGRKNEEVVRHRFLKSIFEALQQDKVLELDFVYGSLKNAAPEKVVFLPLDGQQRLTTLFLLYWYIGCQELEEEQLADLLTKLSRFSYSTRVTARKFCEKLSRISIRNNPAKQIKSAIWFHKIFEQDPTVMSMLIMLEDIDQFYQQSSKSLFEQLHRLCFYILPLDGFSLTDELYIKMNSRGKLLTNFENFKADLINWMKDEHNPERDFFQRSLPTNDRKLIYYIHFAAKVDNAWTDIFWAKAKLATEERDKVVDPYFLRLVNRFLLNDYIVNQTKGMPSQSVEESELFNHFYNTSNHEYRLFDYYKGLLNAEVINRLEHILDAFYVHQNVIAQLIRPVWNESDDWFFYDNNISQTQRLLFYCVCVYLERNSFNAEKFRNWMRICWNIIIDPDIRSVPAMINAMRLLKKVSAGSGDIHQYLKSAESEQVADRRDIFGIQLNEERIKVMLLGDEAWIDPILMAESHPLFKGNIRLLIEDLPTIEHFTLRLTNVLQLFGASGPTDVLRKFSLIRYLIAEHKSWQAMQSFSYSDTADNWELILRRNVECRVNLRKVIDLPDMKEIQDVIDESISRESQVENLMGNWKKQVKFIHEALYRDEQFFIWTQASKASKIKFLHDHVYIIKPGAWYTKVMIDCYRNEIITALHKKYHVNLNGHNCAESHYYWGEAIEIYKEIDHITVSFYFDQEKMLFIGLLRKRNLHLSQAILADRHWIQVYEFKYMDINSVDELISIIEHTLAHENECMFKLMFTSR